MLSFSELMHCGRKTCSPLLGKTRAAMEKNHLPKGFTFYNKISILDPKEMTDCAEVDLRIKMTAGQNQITGMVGCGGKSNHWPSADDELYGKRKPSTRG